MGDVPDERAESPEERIIHTSRPGRRLGWRGDEAQGHDLLERATGQLTTSEWYRNDQLGRDTFCGWIDGHVLDLTLLEYSVRIYHDTGRHAMQLRSRDPRTIIAGRGSPNPKEPTSTQAPAR
ncbi:hypothetical protein E4U31_000857 [Claviceps sp. LM219 group G6]|nr:hypothetical protein E4U31_000857 [Claviceps sp. LM219 group G6]